MRRIARGLDKLTIKSNNPFIIPVGYVERRGQIPRVHDIDAPLSTIVSTVKQRLVTPHISKYCGDIVGSDVSEPLETLTAIYHNALAEPRLAPYIMANNTNNVGAATNEPLPTITTGNRNFCGAASFIQYHSEQTDREVRGQTLDAPVMTGDMSNRYALTSAHLIKYYKGDNYSAANAPLHTVTVKERNALIESHLCILRNN